MDKLTEALSDLSKQSAPDEFDRKLGALDGLPDVTRTKPAVIQVVPPLGIGGVEMFVIQTYRQKDAGDLIFLQRVGQEGTTRIVIPAKVAAAIARQRDQLTAKARSKAAKETMANRKASGEVFGFQKRKEG